MLLVLAVLLFFGAGVGSDGNGSVGGCCFPCGSPGVVGKYSVVGASDGNGVSVGSCCC